MVFQTGTLLYMGVSVLRILEDFYNPRRRDRILYCLIHPRLELPHRGNIRSELIDTIYQVLFHPPTKRLESDTD